jgi:hypothetical protein
MQHANTVITIANNNKKSNIFSISYFDSHT